MNERTNDQQQRPSQADEATEQALQAELRREAEEGRDQVGDVSENRNLSGSSTWETLEQKKEGA